jgi:hypothetical protein
VRSAVVKSAWNMPLGPGFSVAGSPAPSGEVDWSSLGKTSTYYQNHVRMVFSGGIGLVLSRQIAEAHGGSLTLQNRPAGRGCEARLRLPV